MPGARLLLVEDDEVLRELILLNLQMRGHEVRVAADGRAALASLQATSFDLIFLDICLGGAGQPASPAGISAAGLPAQTLPDRGSPTAGSRGSPARERHPHSSTERRG